MAKKVGVLLALLFSFAFVSAAATTADAILYSTLLMFLIFMLGLLMLGYYKIPGDARGDDGDIIALSKTAFLKPVLLGGSWIMLTSIVFIAANIAISELTTGIFGSFLFLVYQIMFYSNFILLPLSIIIMIRKLVLSKEMTSMIERGVRFS